MKILHVINIVAPRYGGAGIASRLMAFYQAKLGYEVTICTTNADYPKGKLAVPSHGQPINIDGLILRHFGVSFRPLLFSYTLWKWLKKNIASFDIVHIHGLYRFPVTSAAWLAKKSGVPYIIRPHGSLAPFLYNQSRCNILLKRAYERLLDFPNLNQATAIHFTARTEMENAAFLGLSSRNVIVPNGIDWDQYKCLPSIGGFRNFLGIDRQTPLVLFLGRVSFAKGLDIFVQAISDVIQRHANVRAAIVGPDNDGYLPEVQRWCHDYDVHDKVFFVDYLDSYDVRQAYVDADVFVLPSYTENFGLTVVEAMASGTPVVISDQVNICSEVEMAGAGVVVRLEPRSVSKAICKVIEEKQFAHRMGINGRKTAENKYDWSIISKQLIHTYKELIESH